MYLVVRDRDWCPWFGTTPAPTLTQALIQALQKSLLAYQMRCKMAHSEINRLEALIPPQDGSTSSPSVAGSLIRYEPALHDQQVM